jgi:hypothetical protein
MKIFFRGTQYYEKYIAFVLQKSIGVLGENNTSGSQRMPVNVPPGYTWYLIFSWDSRLADLLSNTKIRQLPS